jgi:3-hydroxyacyl-CoA dehydrogenase
MITSFILKGHGIYQVAAMSGTHKSGIAYEPEQKYLDSGMARIEKSTEKLVSKGKLSSEDAAAVLGRVDSTTDVTKLKDVDFVCEAVIADMDLKTRIYKELSAVCQPDCIFGSNTSSLSITEMAEATNRPEKFVGIHFSNPVQRMPLVEVINNKYTDPAVMDRAVAWVEDIGKTCVTC